MTRKVCTVSTVDRKRCVQSVQSTARSLSVRQSIAMHWTFFGTSNIICLSPKCSRNRGQVFRQLLACSCFQLYLLQDLLLLLFQQLLRRLCSCGDRCWLWAAAAASTVNLFFKLLVSSLGLTAAASSWGFGLLSVGWGGQEGTRAELPLLGGDAGGGGRDSAARVSRQLNKCEKFTTLLHRKSRIGISRLKLWLHNSRVVPNFQSRDFNCYLAHF